MNLSYWEIKTWLSRLDFVIIGSGIVGLSCALQLRSRYPKSNILILEKGILPQGASTKNAGFACFGSLSEIINDLETHSEEELITLIKQRIEGLEILRKTLGDRAIDYRQYGGYELFLESHTHLYESCLDNVQKINSLLSAIYGSDIFSFRSNSFGFENLKPKSVFNSFEGQIDTGKMMQQLLLKAQKSGINILNNCVVESFSEDTDHVKIKTNHFELDTQNLLIATNGFASQLLKLPVEPARAQVLITKPIKDLKVKGTFHLEQGYYYFRNVQNRILFGGGRNLDFKAEQTTEFAQTATVQEQLELLLTTVILPYQNFEIEHRWSGIMGVGPQKQPVVKALGKRVYCGVRLGGMGVAIGSLVGKALADLTN